MKITQRDVEGVVVLDIEGKIMGGTDAEVFQQTIQSLIDRGQSRVLVNLAEVNWINSTGLGILIAGFSQLDKSGGKLKLLHVSERIQSLLKITKLYKIFESFQQEDEAVRSFS